MAIDLSQFVKQKRLSLTTYKSIVDPDDTTIFYATKNVAGQDIYDVFVGNKLAAQSLHSLIPKVSPTISLQKSFKDLDNTTEIFGNVILNPNMNYIVETPQGLQVSPEAVLNDVLILTNQKVDKITGRGLSEVKHKV